MNYVLLVFAVLFFLVACAACYLWYREEENVKDLKQKVKMAETLNEPKAVDKTTSVRHVDASRDPSRKTERGRSSVLYSLANSACPPSQQCGVVPLVSTDKELKYGKSQVLTFKSQNLNLPYDSKYTYDSTLTLEFLPFTQDNITPTSEFGDGTYQLLPVIVQASFKSSNPTQKSKTSPEYSGCGVFFFGMLSFIYTKKGSYNSIGLLMSKSEFVNFTIRVNGVNEGSSPLSQGYESGYIVVGAEDEFFDNANVPVEPAKWKLSTEDEEMPTLDEVVSNIKANKVLAIKRVFSNANQEYKMNGLSLADPIPSNAVFTLVPDTQS